MSIIHYRGIDYGEKSPDMSWIVEPVEMHRNIYRGKNLGNTVTSEQLAAIEDGTFDDMFIGDYWEIPVTIDNVEKNIKWQIADMDYWLKVGSSLGKTIIQCHHLAIVPDEPLYKSVFSSSSQSMYANTTLYQTISKAQAAVDSAFPGLSLTHARCVPYYNSSNSKYIYDVKVDIMTTLMVFGNTLYTIRPGNWYSLTEPYQLALYRLAPNLLRNITFWLSDLSANGQAVLSIYGMPMDVYQTQTDGVLPCFALGVLNS